MDVTKSILDFMLNWADWKIVRAEAMKVSALEKRIAALEAKLMGGAGPVCTACGSSSLTRTGTRDSPGPFGDLGLKEARFVCTICGAETFVEQPLR